MNGPGNLGSVGQSKLSVAVESGAVKKEIGYLNGSKVTVEEISADKFRGIQVSKNKFEDIPKSTRPVRIALKDFRKWLRNCRPVKALEHLLMGKGKRMVLKQNWGPISQEQADKVMEAAKNSEDKEEIAQKIKQFNTTLRELDQKKMDHAKIKLENDEFRKRYKTILAIIDGDLTSDRIDLRKGLVIALPPATEGGDPQCVRLESGSLRVRKDAAKKLGKIFKESDAYQQYSKSKDRVYEIENERKDLKKALADLGKDLKKQHKGIIKVRVDESKQVALNEYLRKRKDESSNMTIDYNDQKDIDDNQLQSIDKEIEDLEEKIAECKRSNRSLKVELSKNVSDVKSCDVDLGRVDDLAMGGGTLHSLLDPAKVDELKKEREDKQKLVDSAQDKLRTNERTIKQAKFELKNAKKKKKDLVEKMEKRQNEHVNGQKRVEKEYADKIKKSDAETEKVARQERKSLAKMVSGTASKEKTGARKAANQMSVDDNEPGDVREEVSQFVDPDKER